MPGQGGGIWTVDDLYEGEKEKEFTTTLHPLAAKAFTVQLRYHEQGFKEGDDGTLVITDQNENCRTRLQVFERLADNEVKLLGTPTHGNPWRLYNLAERGQATLGIVAVSDWDPYGAPDQACPVSFKIDLELKELVTPVHNITQDTWHEYIHEAINEAVDGDELVVSPGSYRGWFSFAGKSITLRSEEGPEKTTLITTYHTGSVVNFVSGENNDAVLSGFTVGGIRVGESDNGNAASPTIKDNIISPSGTSGITIFNGSPIITDNVIETSSYHLYNGIYINGDTSALISGNTISGNGSSGISIVGNGSPTIINNTIKNRNSHGIRLWGGSPVISGNVISGNSGRGIFADSTTCTITDNTISDNVEGGIWNYESDASIITGNRITNNDGSGIDVYKGSSPTINDNEITGNTAYRGGGIMIWPGALPVISGNTISGNHATDRGGGIYGLAAGWVKFEDVIVDGNPEKVRRHSPPFEEPDNTYSGNTHVKQFGSWGPEEDNWCEDAGYDVYIP